MNNIAKIIALISIAISAGLTYCGTVESELGELQENLKQLSEVVESVAEGQPIKVSEEDKKRLKDIKAASDKVDTVMLTSQEEGIIGTIRPFLAWLPDKDQFFSSTRNPDFGDHSEVVKIALKNLKEKANEKWEKIQEKLYSH